MAVSLLQTAEGALDEVSRALIQARQVAVHAGNEGVNDQNMLQADQQEIDNILEQINRVATSTQYGHNYLLDGSRGRITDCEASRRVIKGCSAGPATQRIPRT